MHMAFRASLSARPWHRAKSISPMHSGNSRPWLVVLRQASPKLARLRPPIQLRDNHLYRHLHLGFTATGHMPTSSKSVQLWKSFRRHRKSNISHIGLQFNLLKLGQYRLRRLPLLSHPTRDSTVPKKNSTDVEYRRRSMTARNLTLPPIAARLQPSAGLRALQAQTMRPSSNIRKFKIT